MIPELYIVSNVDEKVNSLINDWKAKFEISSDQNPDLIVVHSDKDSKQSIGVDDVKSLIRELIKKPMMVNQKLVVIKFAENLTVQAQNNFLKTLEEPPDYTRIVLVANYLEPFLDTVISRVTVSSENDITRDILHDETFVNEFIDLLRTDPEMRLIKSVKIGSERSKTELWLDNCLLWIHNKLGNNDTDYQVYSQIGKVLLKGKQYLKANVHVQLTIDWVLLNMKQL